MVQQQSLAKLNPKYSLLIYSYRAIPAIRMAEIEAFLRCGVKVYMFSAEPMYPDSLEAYKAARLFQPYRLQSECPSLFEFLTVCDGKGVSLAELQELENAAPEFNHGQFAVEHGESTTHLCIEAGAGTGKTTVMIQRVMFLLQAKQVPLEQIVMITFTNEAARHMRRTIYAELFNRFEVTGLSLYRDSIEMLPKMRISTIHAFGKSLIQDIGSSLGYGRTVQIRSFSLERKRIVEEHLNDFFQTHSGKKKDVGGVFQGMRLFEVINLVLSFWERMERLGLVEDDIAQLDWGKDDPDTKDFQDLFKFIFPKIEKSLQDIKVRTNSVSLEDITRQVELAGRQSNILSRLSTPISYLFIDEFQDTDDNQIRLAYRLSLALGVKLFVVGDIKQSIYRFRGADYTAFDQLGSLLQKYASSMTTYTLVRNYRTKDSLLRHMDIFFTRWGENNWLVYSDKHRLIGRLHPPSEDEWRLKRVKGKELEKQVLDWVDESLASSSRSDSTALLVRTNRQAKQLKQWFETRRPGTPVSLDIGGSFYTSDAVNDCLALIRALLYPQEPQHLLAFLNSSFSDSRMHWTSLIECSGNADCLRKVLKPQLPPGWHAYVSQVRVQPIPALLREIIEDTRPVENYYGRRLAEHMQRGMNPEQVESETLYQAYQYQENLALLFDLMHEKFSGDFVTLFKLEQWLTICQTVDRSVDEPLLPENVDQPRVRITTVHKAKGLDFHTVIIPFTNHQFHRQTSEFLAIKPDSGSDARFRAGWRIEHERGYNNENYLELSRLEREEVVKDEARLLYVAMTRVKERLWILASSRATNNWSQLLAYKE